MCLAIFKPKGAVIKKKYLRNGFDANEDGAGFAVAIDNAVIIQKGYFTFKEFYTAFKEFNTPKQPAIVHFRMATHGGCNEANCHPFTLCGGKYAAIHNGIIDIECTDKSRSDTAHFCELVLEPMLATVDLASGALRYLVEQSIGTMNKLVILAADGSHIIYNEKEGEWTKGCWYSNSGYRYGGLDMASLTRAYCSYTEPKSGYRPYSKDYSPLSKDERDDAAYWGDGREWSYQHETNTWEERTRNKRIAEMSEADWRKEQADELNAALQAEEENDRYSG